MAKPENTRKNTRKLTPAMEAKKWKKGCPSPNPGGRPKRILTDDLIARFESDPALVRALNTAMLKKARSGDVKAYQALRDGVEGKPLQQLEATLGSDKVRVLLIGLSSA